jgi:hypothetical protein
MINKKIVAVDFVLIVGSLLIIAGLVGYSRPMAIAPLDNIITSEPVLFRFEKADLILIDDNLDFSSPEKIYAEDDLIINLKPGKYYWKIEGVLESEVRELTIQSEVNLKLNNAKNGNYEVLNGGSVKLDVDIYNGGNLVGRTVLDIDENKEVSGTKFLGRENEGE